MIDLASLSDGARTFAELLLARRPNWENYLRAYRTVHADDETMPGSLWLELPANGTHGILQLLVQDTEALLIRGDHERLFVWQPSERFSAIAVVLAAVETDAAHLPTACEGLADREPGAAR